MGCCKLNLFGLFLRLPPLGPWHWTESFSDDPEDLYPSQSCPRNACTINPTSIPAAHYNVNDYTLSRCFEHSGETEILQKIPPGSTWLISTAGYCLQRSCCGRHLIAFTGRAIWLWLLQPQRVGDPGRGHGSEALPGDGGWNTSGGRKIGGESGSKRCC